jgi:hypothetical protein
VPEIFNCRRSKGHYLLDVGKYHDEWYRVGASRLFSGKLIRTNPLREIRIDSLHVTPHVARFTEVPRGWVRFSSPHAKLCSGLRSTYAECHMGQLSKDSCFGTKPGKIPLDLRLFSCARVQPFFESKLSLPCAAATPQWTWTSRNLVEKET